MKREEMSVRLECGEDPLELSIQKWRDIVHHLEHIKSFDEYDDSLERGSLNCALCEVHSSCLDCPIVTQAKCHTSNSADGRKYGLCRHTPYYEFLAAVARQDVDAMRATAKKELQFLNQLQTELQQRSIPTDPQLAPMSERDIRAYCKEYARIERTARPELNAVSYTVVLKFPLLVNRIECSSPELWEFVPVSQQELQNESVHLFFTFAFTSLVHADAAMLPLREEYVIDKLYDLIRQALNEGHITAAFSEDRDGIEGTVTFYISEPLRIAAKHAHRAHRFSGSRILEKGVGGEYRA